MTTMVVEGTVANSIWATNTQEHDIKTAGPSDFMVVAIGQTNLEITF